MIPAFHSLCRRLLYARKNVFYLLLLMIFSEKVFAQQLYINLLNMTTETYPISGIRSITFQQNTLQVNAFDGSVTSYPFSSIMNYTFRNTTAMEHPSGYFQVSVFPNPADEEVSICIDAKADRNISIQIRDLSGKPVAIVYEGLHKPGKVYQWKVNVLPGTYVCSIHDGHKTISKQIVIQ